MSPTVMNLARGRQVAPVHPKGRVHPNARGPGGRPDTGIGRSARWVLALALAGAGPAPASAAGSELSLSLDEAVGLALQANRTLHTARDAREVEKLSLEVSEDRYRPRASIESGVRDASGADPRTGVSAGMNLRVPTGGEIALKWSGAHEATDEDRERLTLGFSQPLLKGFGPAIDTAPLRLAHLRETRNVLSLRATIATVVTSVVTAYRDVIRAHNAITISRESLDRARRQLEVNRSLIRAGRMAAHEIIQSEAEIANRQLALVESEMRLVSANAALLTLLDLDDAMSVRTQSTLPSAEAPARLGLESSIETALAQRTDYRTAQIEEEEATIALALARDEQRWNLTLTADISRVHPGGHDASAGLALAIPFGDRTPDLAAMRARTALRNAQRTLVDLRQSIRIGVRRALHDVEVGFRRIALARQARELAQAQIDVEREKLAQGLTSTFQVSAVEDDLIAAKTRELDATIAYLNAHTALDRALGTTLRTWGIDIAGFDASN